jgi:membrane protein DedA with SNARE-associated domain
VLDFILNAIDDRPTTYLIVAGIVFVDDFIPVAPGDTAMITAGILAANDALIIGLVIAAGAIGGILGDNVFYFLGRRLGARLAGRLIRSERSAELYRRAERQIAIRGGTIVLVGRFVPGGRTATTFACGTVGVPLPTFLPRRRGGRDRLGGLHRAARVRRRQRIPGRTLATAAYRAGSRPPARAGGGVADPARRRQRER